MRQLDLALPPPWVRGVLVLAFLGFGVLVGNATSSPAGVSTASVRPRVRLVLPPASPASVQETADAASPSSPRPPRISRERTPEAGTSQAATGTSGHNRAGSPGSDSRGSGSTKEAPSGAAKLPAVKHVFLIVLADQPYAAVFGPASKAGYLAHTLEKRGELLVRYYAVAHDELANGIALVSGQGPTPETAVNCPTFADIAPATVAAEGQVTGHGCVYPKSTPTLADQLTAKHLTWRAYLEGKTAGACPHPALGAGDPPLAGAEYATFRNPFLYFHGVIDSSAACAAGDVGMEQLSADLRNPKRTPSLSYIVPSLCHDGHVTPCAPGQAGGMAPADAFLRKVVPQILAAKAYKDGGLLAITVDQAPATGLEADSSSCCGQPRFPGLPAPAGPAAPPAGAQLPPSGGGQVGALLLSPFVKAGSVNQDPYNHFALLRTVEDLFGLEHLGYAGGSEVKSLNAAVFNGSGEG